ncbi:hypothetical protein KRX56_01295 [Dermabacteraceae bacterium TAE3-ERU27]|nr:hypothetical protein [Dermabacteraceae bacterium TAE3-ERU27]
METPDVCVVTGGDEVRYRSYINHSVYAREHGFSYHIGIGLLQEVTSPYWYKFGVIEEVLTRYDWTMWVDDDVYITKLTKQDGLDVENLIQEAEEKDAFMVIANSPVNDVDPLWTNINTGVILFKNDPRSVRVLREAREISLDVVKEGWTFEKDGLFTNGDQDTVWHVIKSDEKLLAGVHIVDYARLNYRDYLYKDSLHDGFAVHFCGPGDKVLRTAVFGKRFGLGQELVPTELLDKWSVRKRQVMSDAEIAKRSAVVKANLLKKKVVRKIEFVKENKRWK